MRSSSPASLLRRVGLILSVGMVAVLAVGATSAFAATVTKDGTVITVTGTDAAEDLNVRYDGNGEDSFEFRDQTGANVLFGAGCTVDDEDAAQAQCPAAGTTRFVINLAGGGDATDFAASVDGVPATIDGGDGDDCDDGGTGDLRGTDQGDIINGGAGQDCINGRDGDDTIDGGAGDDFDLDGNQGNDTVLGGEGADFIEGNDGDDPLLDGGPGDDAIRGQAGNDTLAGGEGRDFLQGGVGDDTERGGDGNDQVNGAEGADSLYGEGGNDIVNGGFEETTAVPDLIDGGEGIDLADYSGRPDDEPVTVTLDNQANDGRTDEGDNVVNIEDVAGGAGADVLQSLIDGPNQFSGGPGNDTVDPGLFEDVVFAQAGDDTVNANDGYADVVSCGDGADTANVDSTDFVQPDCEVVNRTERLSARDIPEDLPPAVTFTGPAANTTVPGRATLTADAIDDRGVARVLFIDEDQVVCSDDTAPYSCEYTAGGEDVGRKTLSAVAVDTIGQTATSNRTIFVPRFSPTISVGVSPRADRRFPFTFTVSGRLTPPAGVSNAAACRGSVSVQIKSRGTTISNRTVRVGANCRYTSRVTFRVRRRITSNRLTIRARYNGTDTLTGRISRRISVGVRRG